LLIATLVTACTPGSDAADDQLYGPLSRIGTVARIDIETGRVTPIAENLGKPIALNLDANGRIWVVDLSTGHLRRIDPGTRDSDSNDSHWADAQIVSTIEPITRSSRPGQTSTRRAAWSCETTAIRSSPTSQPER
jgi:hypothetical protein